MATATSKLNIIIDVLGDKAQSSLGGIQKSLATIAVVTGTVVAAGIAAKKAWDFVKEGAELEKVAIQFGNVATNAGYMSDVLLGKMRQATGGMVTDAELMASGLSIIELGLADSEQGVVDLATVVSTLGLDMQQVIMTFANDSVMRLDALGLSVETVTKRAAELKAQGFVGDAFDQAVLEGLQQRMEVLGDVSETTAGQMQKLETSWTNVSNAFKQSVSQSIAPVINAISDEMDAANMLTTALDAGAISQERFNELARLLYDVDPSTIYKIAEVHLSQLADTQARANAEAADADRLFGNLVGTWTSGNAVAEMYAANASAAADATYDYSSSISDANSSMSTYNQRLQEAAGAYSTLSTNIYSVTQRLQDNLDFINAGGLALISLTSTAEEAMDEGNFEGAQLALDAAAQGAIDLDLELGNIDPTTAIERLMELGLGPEEAKLKVQEFEDSLFAVTTKRWVVQVDMVVSQSGSLPPGVNIPIPGGGGNTGGGPGGGDLTNPGQPGINSINGGTGGSDIFIDSLIIIPPTDASMKNLIREAASSAAGSGYTG